MDPMLVKVLVDTMGTDLYAPAPHNRARHRTTRVARTPRLRPRIASLLRRVAERLDRPAPATARG